MSLCEPGSDWLRAGRSGDRIPVWTKFSAPVQTGPGDHPASSRMGNRSFPGIKSCPGVTLTPHPLLVSWPRKSRAILLLPVWVVRSVQSLSAYARVYFTNFICLYALNRNKSTVSCQTAKVISNFNASNVVRFVIRR